MGALMLAPAVFAFGLVAFGFLGMGPVTIAVDSYGPVTDNAQSVYELSTIERSRTSKRRSRRTSVSSPISRTPRRTWKRTTARATRSKHRQAGADRHRRGRRHHHDFLHHRGADERAAAGTADESVDPASAVPARPDHGRRGDLLVHRRFHAGRDHGRLSRGGVHQGEHQAGEARPRRRSRTSKKVVEICTQYAQKGMFKSSWWCSSPRWHLRSSSRTSSSAI